MINIFRVATAPKPFARMLALGAALSLLAACTPGVKKDDTAEVEQRAVQRWEYLIAHEAEKAYDYLTPGYRKTITREVYAATMNHRPVQWTSVKYTGRKCEGDRCSVSLLIDYSLEMAGLGRPAESMSPQRENWIRVRGTWYFLPSD